ncbi:MAG: type II toxin-antitoxin system VapC family toxin [Chloroflexi bacterium]|nr:type II toxin-antitoxin system VapC family toxin [Chloroflexota bacterium]
MTYLVDSDWVADYLKGRPGAVTLLDRLFPDGIAISIVTFAEVCEGIYYGRDPKRNEQIFRRFLEGVIVVGISRPIARRFALIRGNLRAKGQLIPQPDLFIAATALHHRFTLLTRNAKDFERIHDLKLYQSELPAG